MKIKLFVYSSLFITAFATANSINIKTIKSNFYQTVINEQNAKVTYKGRLFASQNDNRALWEYTSPINKKIYYNGDGKLTIIEPDLEQVVFTKLDKVPNILKLLKDAKKSSDGRLKTRFNGATYYIKTNNNKIESISYTDEMQNRVKISFTNETINAPIKKEVFKYHIPKGYDILEQR